MRKSFKTLAIVLVASVVMPLMSGVETVNAAQDYKREDRVRPVESHTIKEEMDFPDIIDEEEIKTKGYIGRHKDEEKDLYTLVFENGDGTKTMRVFSHPVKYINEKGETKDISLDIKKGSYGKYETSEHEIKTTFKERLTDGISLEYDDVAINMIPLMENISSVEAPVATLKDEKAVTYMVDDKTSFEYELTYAGFKEDIVVNEYTGQTEYEFIL